jgi:hypothetical protein
MFKGMRFYYHMKNYMSSSIDTSKKIYLIVHGQHQFIDPIKEKLVMQGFEKENMQIASLDRTGNASEYVAMIWPPMAPKEIVISEIVDTNTTGGSGMGAWSSVSQKELYRIPLVE